MALTESNMLDLGIKAPDFALPNAADDKIYNYAQVRGAKATLVMFLCNHCPYVIFINAELVKLANEYAAKGVGFVAISSNDAQKYPADSYENMRIHAQKEGYPFPYLYDESQAVAKAYDAACTPDFYLFDGADLLAYRGRFCEARPSNGLIPNGQDLRTALDTVLSGGQPSPKQYPSAGCNIKWKPD